MNECKGAGLLVEDGRIRKEYSYKLTTNGKHRVLHGNLRPRCKDTVYLEHGCAPSVRTLANLTEIQQKLRRPRQGYSGKCRDDFIRKIMYDDLAIAARAVKLEFSPTTGMEKNYHSKAP